MFFFIETLSPFEVEIDRTTLSATANTIAYISHLTNAMAKESNIVHQYFKKQFDDFTVMVKVDPIQLKGTEITIEKNGSKEMRHLKFDEAGYSTPEEVLKI